MQTICRKSPKFSLNRRSPAHSPRRYAGPSAGEKFISYPITEFEPGNHYHSFVVACLGGPKTDIYTDEGLTFYAPPKRTNIIAARAAPIIGPTTGTQEYFQSLFLFPGTGRMKCIILGPRSRAGLMA